MPLVALLFNYCGGSDMSENNIETSVTEENVVSKVAELMETLDRVKKYNVFAASLKVFSVLTVGSIVLFLVIGAFFGILNFPLHADISVSYYVVVFLLFLIPISGLVMGIVFMRGRINAVKTGEWKEELSHGFPSAIKILSELDWDKTLDEISRGRISYTLYGVLRTIMVWFITFFAIRHIGGLLTFAVLHGINLVWDLFYGLFALLIIILILHKDLLTRYNEIRSLDSLLWELRWFSHEFGGAEFKT